MNIRRISELSGHVFSCKLPVQSTGRTRAFTLTELLVCIAIIGILAALIIPVVGMVKNNATKAQCSSNLRQCATGINLYAAEHRGLAPGITWTLEIQPYISGVGAKGNAAYTNTDTAFPVSCPSLPYDNSKYGRSTYSMNSWLDTDHSNQNTDANGKVSFSWYMPLRNVEAPSRKIMLFDGILASSSPDGSQWAFNAVKGAQYIDFRHPSSMANVLFVDGHVDTLTKSQIHDGMWDWEGGGQRPSP
jgi:prepilin-type N-terminal cleavage/methylation domain-containing protein/prepilin-type processing-associated H-X9-DG protein